VIGCVALLLSVIAPAPGSAARAGSSNVVVNRVRLSVARVRALERQYRVRIPDGRYWYDRRCGAWGRDGGPTQGFTLTGLALGGPLRADASRGRTQVFINGRELPSRDLAALQQIVPQRIAPGRYWVDASGNSGCEGGPRLCNLVELARRAGRARGGAWNVHTRTTDAHVGGDGGRFLFYIDRDTGWTPD
jgi:hypothetical protein